MILYEFPEDYLFEGLVTQGAVLMDGGCGLGSTTLFLCQRIMAEGGSGRVLAVDIDGDDLAFAAERIRSAGYLDIASFLHADLSRLDSVPDSCVDRVFLNKTVCWLESSPLGSVKAMLELRRVLKPGGRLSIMDEMPPASGTGAMGNPWHVAWEAQSALRHLTGSRHLVSVSPGDLQALLELAGFKSVEWKAFGGEPVDRDAPGRFARKLLDQSGDPAGPLAKAMSAVASLVDNASGPAMSPGTYVMHAWVES